MYPLFLNCTGRLCLVVGGGTVAAFFRRLGIPAVVWGRNEGQAHQPNEFCVIANMVGNAKVYAHLCGQL